MASPRNAASAEAVPEVAPPEAAPVTDVAEDVAEEPTLYLVSAAVAVLPIEGGSERYLYRGAVVGSGYTESGIEHALSVGLIRAVK